MAAGGMLSGLSRLISRTNSVILRHSQQLQPNNAKLIQSDTYIIIMGQISGTRAGGGAGGGASGDSTSSSPSTRSHHAF